MKKNLPLWLLLSLVYGCGGGGGGDSSPPPEQPVQLSSSVSGGGVKGPLANASFALYKFDSSYINFQAATTAYNGRTDSHAKFSIDIPTADLDPPYILVFSADDQTTDLMTGGAPLINIMKTVVTQDMLDSGANIYATPLTTMAVDVAIKNALSNVPPYKDDTDYQNATTTKDRFLAALPIAAQQVKSTLGFGLGQDVDIYTTSPIVDSSTDTDTKLNNTAQYRAAVEALGAVVKQVSTEVSNTFAQVDNNTMVQILTADLQDGKIDGKDADGNDLSAIMSPEVLSTIQSIDPQKLNVPGTNLTVEQMTQQLASETTLTGNTSTSTSSLTNNSITITTQPAQVDPDRDGDGVLNSNDAFPDDPTADKDSDHDGVPDVAYTDSSRTTIDTARSDNDDDNDGWLDANDDYPTDSAKHLNPDLDRDSDGELNGVDPCPLDANDGCVAITDSDSDGVPDSTDNCPTMSNPGQVDTDGDTVLGSPSAHTGGNVCDDDDDGDGVADAQDAFPLDATEYLDTDHDGVGDNTDTDDDNDGVLDVNEAPGCSLLRDCDGDGRMDNNDAFPLNPKEWVDSDGDCGTITTQTETSGDDCGLDGNGNQQGGNNADADDDGDAVVDTQDSFPLDPARSSTITDADGDGIDDGSNGTDNCPTVYNPLQIDTDKDGQGDACDTDDDNDNVPDISDVFPLNPNESADTDHDGIGDHGDNCPTVANAGQLDTDLDGQGNVCDNDDDDDGVADTADAFPLDPTADTDTDKDGTPDVAYTDASRTTVDTARSDTDDDNDGVLDVNEASVACSLLKDCDSDGYNDDVDVFPTDKNEHADSDQDTVGDNSDNCPTMANANQLDTDSDGQGDACDTDDDNDGLTDSQEQQLGTNPLVADTDGDTVNDDIDNCPLVSNTDQLDDNNNQIGDACENAVSGAYSAAITTTGHTTTQEPVTGMCWSSQDEAKLNVAENTYFSVNISGSEITIDGSIVGTVNTDGTFTATQTDSGQDSYYDENQMVQVTMDVSKSLTVTGSISGGTVSGNWTESRIGVVASNTVLDCDQTGTVSSSLVYAPTGTEDYSSVYAVEAELDKWDQASNSSVSQRQAYAGQFVFDKTNKTVAFYDSGADTVSSSYDPVSGHFDITFVDRKPDTFDANYDNYQDLVQHSNTLHGVLIAAPGSATPEMWIDSIDGTQIVYCGDASTQPPADTSGTPCQTNPDGGGRGYAKMVSTKGYNNVFTNPSTSSTTQDQAFLQLLNPPVMDTSTNSTLYFEAYNGATASGTPLCSVPFDQGRYQWRQDLPRPDFASMAVLTSPYSRVNCPLATADVVVGQQYTLVVRDDAGTGDTMDDVTVYSTVYTATATAIPPGVLPDRRSLNINGAMPSQTEASNYLSMNGYFNPKANLNFTWPVPASGADQYSVRLWGYNPYDTTSPLDNTEYRMTTSTSACSTECLASVALEPNATDNSYALAARLMTRYKDANGYYAFSQSKYVVFGYGLNGMVNVEMLDPNNTPKIFQLAVQSDDQGNIVNCSYTPVGGDSCSMQTTPNFQTAYGYIDYTTDKVTIFTTAGDLVLTFSDAVNATATLGANVGNAKVVTSEMVAKTRIYAGGTPTISTQLYLSNPVPAYDMATLTDLVGSGSTLDGTNTSLLVWDNTGANNYYATVFQFAASDWDGVPARNLTSASFDSKSTTGMQLDDGSYQISLTGGSSFGMPDSAYKVAYAYTDPSALAPPLRTAMKVDGTAGTGGASGTGTSTLPLTVASFIGTITWQSTAAASTTEWQVMIRGEDGSNQDVIGQDIRTSWMVGNVHPKLTVQTDTPMLGINTWTWTNPGIPTYAFASTGTTGTAKILLRVRPAGDGPIEGISQAFFVTSTAP